MGISKHKGHSGSLFEKEPLLILKVAISDVSLSSSPVILDFWISNINFWNQLYPLSKHYDILES